MAPQPFGASRAEWEALGKLCLADLLPTICDPSVQPDARSLMQGLTRAPSLMLDNGKGRGIARWPDLTTTSTLDWQQHPEHGICIITRRIRAIDIDITDEAWATYAQAVANSVAGAILPMRGRAGSSKRLLVYRLIDPPGPLKKTVVESDSGNVEFLHDRQQFIAAGMHWSGTGRYEWPEGIPESIEAIPAITFEQLRQMHAELGKALRAERMEWAFTTTDMIPLPRSQDQVDAGGDPIIKFLAENDWIKSFRSDGSINVRSPWADRYSTPDKEDSAVFYPAGLGGRSEPGFRDLHGSGAGRTATDFLEAIGYREQEIIDEFDVIETPDLDDGARPAISMTRQGKVEPILANVMGLLGWRSRIGFEIHYDSFKDMLLVREWPAGEWRAVTDNTYTTLRMKMHLMGLSTISKENVRDAVHLLAEHNTVDSAIGWLKGLKWDGKRRIDYFHTEVLGLPDTPYNKAVCMYLWTALAGRVMEPGVKADMVPILSGRQGLRKSSLIQAIAPSADEFTTINMTQDDADLGRQLRGKVIAEWDELRGLTTRDVDMLKGWVSRTHDEWTPKFKEFAHKQPRRFIVVGTVNGKRFLSDPTGLRRWLPLYVTATLDVNYVTRNRNQLWAEARELFMNGGVQWERAETLAPEAHRKATTVDVWTPDVARWLRDRPGEEGWDTAFLLVNAIGMPSASAGAQAQKRMTAVMTYLGYEENENGKWVSSLA